MKQIFLGQNGNPMLNGQPDIFSLNFDCQLTLSKLYNQNRNPKTIYTKTDFLPIFVNQVLPHLESEFVLITACSDYSPEINYNLEYRTLISSPKLKFWFMNNMKSEHQKTKSLPAGLAAGQFWDNCSDIDVENLLLSIRKNVEIEKKIDKIFCCFRNRDWNVCGEDMIIRPSIMETIKDRTDIFDFYHEDSLNFEEFVTKISHYKYSLCPHGNGMDPNPSAWLSLIVYTTPIIYKTTNSVSMFEDTNSVIFFENNLELLDTNIKKEKPQVDFDFLTMDYWANKIKNKI